jgi:hypothetical protein
VALWLTIRPELIERTLRSFQNNLFRSYADHRLIINIDPVRGRESQATRKEALAVVDRYFTRKKVRLPRRPHFPKAIHWLWAEAESEFVFHLEDDWECVVKLDLERMIAVMRSQSDLLGLRLNAYRTWSDRCRPSSAASRSDWLWNGQYYENSDGRGGKGWYSNHPTLFRRDWIQATLPFLGTEGSTERYINGFARAKKQLTRDLVLKWRYGIFAVPSPRCIRDIGRAWRTRNRVIKNARWNFTHWQAVKETNDGDAVV